MPFRLLLASLITAYGLGPALSEEVPYFRWGNPEAKEIADSPGPAPSLQVTGIPPRASAGDPVTGAIVFANAVPPVSYTVAPGTALPDGLNLGSDGLIYGAPKAPGNYSATIQARDATGKTALATVPIEVLPLTATLVANPARPVFSSGLYAVPVTASDGSALSGISLVSAPNWLILNGGTVLGLVPAGVSTFSYGIIARDAYQRPLSASFTVSSPAPSGSVSLPGTMRGGASFAARLTSNLDDGTWSVAGLTGMSIDASASSTTTVRGTAPVSGSLTLQASRLRDDGAIATAQASATVVPAMTASWPNGMISVTRSSTEQAFGSAVSSNSLGTGVTWASVPGLPAGITVSRQGRIEAAANATGDWTGFLRVTDNEDQATAQTDPFVISIQPPVLIGTVASAALSPGSTFSIKPNALATGGSGGYTYMLRNAAGTDISDSPPFGAFNKSTGTWSGTAPASYAAQVFTIRALDVRDRPATTDGFTVSVDVATVANTCFTLVTYFRNFAVPVAANGYTYRYNYAANAGDAYVYGQMWSQLNGKGSVSQVGFVKNNHTGPAGVRSGSYKGVTQTGVSFDRGAGTGSMWDIEIVPTYNGATKGPC